ncbi:hypothetical protein CALVIDRAFT_561669 [Calocera viscosa TUFC12733]|uniref:Uncharacterized protein n=1 Tax=Calocera viscosa (strain TUFC12733) TaxID=1330018 RepID=A0A167PF29_CALVF|nr:hypothetical protein CALVIDRAFT_561669 [Calocera viscosa TUFC12733]
MSPVRPFSHILAARAFLTLIFSSVYNHREGAPQAEAQQGGGYGWMGHVAKHISDGARKWEHGLRRGRGQVRPVGVLARRSSDAAWLVRLPNPVGKLLGCSDTHSATAGTVTPSPTTSTAGGGEVMRRGAAHIEITTSEGVGSVIARLEVTQVMKEEILAITTTVKNTAAIITTSHCYTNDGVRNSIEARVWRYRARYAYSHARTYNMSDHHAGNPLDEPTAKLMGEKDIYLTPTLAVHGIIMNPLSSGRSSLRSARRLRWSVMRAW